MSASKDIAHKQTGEGSMTHRRNFPASAKREITDRATDNKGILRCEGCSMDLTGKAWEIDHILAEAIVPEWKKTEKLTAKDGQLLGNCCHRGEGGKTARDVKKAAKEKRQNSKYTGAKRPKQTMQSRGFTKTDKPRKIDKKAIEAVALPRTGGLGRQYQEG